MSFLIQISLTIFLQVLVGLYFLPTTFNTYQLPLTFLDIFCFTTFSFGVFLQIQIILFPFFYFFYQIKKVFGGIFLSLTGAHLIFFTICNYIVFYNEGLHLIEPQAMQLFSNPNWNREIQLTLGTVLSLLTVIGLLFLLEFLLFLYLDRKNGFLKFDDLTKKISSGVLITLIASGCFTHFYYFKNRGEVLEFFPFFNHLYKNKGQEPLILTFDNDFTPKHKDSQIKKHLFFLMVESLRGDRFNPENMPLLYKYTKEKNCYVSPRHFAGGHTTEYGIFTAFYGVLAHNFENFREKSIPPFPVQFLKNNGYEILGASASSVRSWNRLGFIQTIYDDYKEFLGDKVYPDDLAMVDWALNRLNPSKLQFLFLFFNSPHHDYYYPPEYEIYKPTVPKNFNYLTLAGKPDLKQQFFNKYRNSIRFLDYNLVRFLKAAEKKMDGNIIFSLIGDHGEEFWERGYHGHSGASLIKERVESPLIICDLKNKMPKSNFPYTNHIDIFPSLLSILFPMENFNNKFNGKNIFKPFPYHYSVVATPLFPQNKERVLLVHGNTKFYLEKTSRTLHDLNLYKVTDLDDHPKEINDQVMEEYITLKKKFISDAYKFLKPKEN